MITPDQPVLAADAPAAVWAACIVGAYVTGSIPFGVIIGRLRGIDIREHGSRNVGATNVTRVLGKRLGAACLVLDVLKGAAPVLVAGIVCGVLGREPAPGALSTTDMWLWLAVASAAIGGHMASVFLRFGGGKGVATGFGTMVAMWPLLTFPALAAVAVWYVVLKLTRYVSVASMSAAASLPVWLVFRLVPPSGERVLPTLAHAAPLLIATAGLGALVVWRHRANIGRLRRGEEGRIGGGSDGGR